MGDRSDGTPLVVVCGLPGVGKSTVSRAIADRLDAAVLRTDVVRKELFEEPAYTAEETAAVYDELLSRARERLYAGPVVLDGTFEGRDRRADARDLAASTGASFRLVRVDCDEAVVEERIAERDGVSDADLDVHRRFRDRFDPVEMDHLVVDNSGTEAATRRRIEEAF
jgi:predicted kinase